MSSAIVQQFERLWESSDSPPDVFGFLEKQEGISTDDVISVLMIDQGYRWNTDDPLKVEDYLARIPSLNGTNTAIYRLLIGELSKQGFEVPKEFESRIMELASLGLESDQAGGSGHFNFESGLTNETVSFAVKSLGSTQPESPASKRPTRNEVANYEIVEEIARGGMGVVYRARQTRLNRDVALKMIRSGEFAGRDEIRRFESEAEAAARLDHPGIVPIFEIGEHDGNPFFSMALIEGESLSAKLRGGPMQTRLAAELVKKIAEAIAFAHSKGVIHRDLKPANVLIEKNGNPKVTDFGLAKKVGGDSELTGTGQILGTPSYMPPEQASGESAQADEKADVYALGAILYFTLVNRPPFQGSTPMDTLKQVLEREPVSPRTLDPKIPRDLETICLKCLSKEPDSRYVSASAFAADLDRWLNHEPIQARPVSHVEKAWKWCKRRPALTGTIVTAILVLVVVSAVLLNGRNDAEATRIVNGLLKADTSQIGTIIKRELPAYLSYARDDLKVAFEKLDPDSNAALHAALAILPKDKSVLPYLKGRLLTVTPMQFQHVRDLLEDDKDGLVASYWETVETSEDPALRFQAACALAKFDPKNEDWQDKDFQTFIASHLVDVRPSELLPWTNALEPVSDCLIAPLSRIYSDPEAGEQVRSFATDTLAEYLSEDVNRLFDLLADANEKQFGVIFTRLSNYQEQAIELGSVEVAKVAAKDASEAEKESLAMRQANVAVMLLRMDASDKVWPLLKHSPDPRVRSYIIHWLGPRGGDARTIIARYEQESDVTIKRALLLCLGEFELSDEDKEPLIETLLTVYRSDPDAGLHAAAEWLLRRWSQAEKLAAIDKDLQKKEQELVAAKNNKREWYINGQGQTFVIIDAGEFRMGSSLTEDGRNSTERLHRRNIGRRFAIATKEVTHEQWRMFSQANPDLRWYSDQEQLKASIRSDDSPMISMTWYEAAWYCNWLSEQEGIPEKQWCYEKNAEGNYGPGMKAKENFLELTGYRLPTEAEWEYACRAGASSSRYYGVTEALLPRYAWYEVNGENHTHPVASLKPNDYGLFDMQGNAYEWCYDAYGSYPTPKEENAVKDAPPAASVEDAGRRVLRGGSFFAIPWDVRSSYRGYYQPFSRYLNDGFRPARTYHLFPKPL